MLLSTGTFDSSGNPLVTFFLSGTFSGGKKEFQAIIDTGFTGFLVMPMIQAFPLGLPLLGTTSVTLADGKTSTRLTALGTVQLAEESKSGVVILEWDSNDLLVGMDFLRTFGKALFLSSKSIHLIDEAEMNAMVQKATESKEKKEPMKASSRLQETDGNVSKTP